MANTPTDIPNIPTTMSPIICTVDVVLLTLLHGRLHVALCLREHEPFADVFALPGGYVHTEEDSDTRAAALRVLQEKTAIDILGGPYLEQLASFSGPGRDPRGWSLSVAYYALIPAAAIEQARHPGIRLTAVDSVGSLPFDHRLIIDTAVERVRNKSTYSSLPVYLCAEPFTLPQLQAVYEAILEEPVNKVSFRRKMDELGVLEPIEGERQTGGAHRPAQLYRLRKNFRQRLSLTGRGLNPD